MGAEGDNLWIHGRCGSRQEEREVENEKETSCGYSIEPERKEAPATAFRNRGQKSRCRSCSVRRQSKASVFLQSRWGLQNILKESYKQSDSRIDLNNEASVDALRKE